MSIINSEELEKVVIAIEGYLTDFDVLEKQLVLQEVVNRLKKSKMRQANADAATEVLNNMSLKSIWKKMRQKEEEEGD
jgi:hypothetical protein